MTPFFSNNIVNYYIDGRSLCSTPPPPRPQPATATAIMSSSQNNAGWTFFTPTTPPMTGAQLRKEARAWGVGGTIHYYDENDPSKSTPVKTEAQIWADIQAEKERLRQLGAAARAAVRS